jgi:glutathione peroxidase
MAFPCNNFLQQEPGSNAEVREYVESIGVNFTVMGKIECENGKQTHPLYRFLKHSLDGGIMGRRLKWNYTKFLVDADGVPIKRGGPTDSPLSLESDIVALLNK